MEAWTTEDVSSLLATVARIESALVLLVFVTSVRFGMYIATRIFKDRSTRVASFGGRQS